MAPSQPIVGMAATRNGQGYWVVAVDGTVERSATPGFTVRRRGLRYHSPSPAIAATPNSNGYWLVGADGQVFTLGRPVLMGRLKPCR